MTGYSFFLRARFAGGQPKYKQYTNNKINELFLRFILIFIIKFDIYVKVKSKWCILGMGNEEMDDAQKRYNEKTGN